MPTRPSIELRVPERTTAGDVLVIEAIVDASVPVDITEITLSLEGQQWIRCAHCNSLHPRERKPEVRERVQVRPKGTLQQGRHRFDASFRLDAGVTPTYSAEHSYFEWTAKCNVDIPWWPDANAKSRVWILPRATERPPPMPHSIASHRGGIQPYVEATLSDRVYGRGDTIHGSVAIGDLRGEKIVEVTYALHKREVAGPHRSDGWQRTKIQDTYASRGWIPPESVVEGAPMPIEVAVPIYAMPSMPHGYSVKIEHFLTILVRTNESKVVLDAPIALRWLQGEQASWGPSLEIGEARWREVWASAAHSAGESLTVAPDRLALEGRMGDLEVALARPPDGGMWMTFELRWPARWGLDLSIKKRRVPMPWDDPFEQAYAARARDPMQLEVVLRPLRALLCGVEGASVDDERARGRFEIQNFEAAAIAKAVASVRKVADAFMQAQAQTPPPPAMRGAVAAWNAAAEKIGARFVVGAMALENEDPELPARIATLFDGEKPIGTRLEVCFHPPLDEAPADPGASAEALRREGKLAIDALGVRLDVPSAAPDPAPLLALYDRVRTMAHELRTVGASGPYR